MPFQPDKVHTYVQTGMGAEKLVATNFYKRFERRIGDHQVESYNAQGGAWYTNGGDSIPFEDVPDWVWAEVRIMDPGYRALYRILLPEEKKSGKRIPTIEQSPEWPTAGDVIKALGELDPTCDTDWAEDGRPNLTAVKAILGAYVPRKKLDMIAPNFVRPVVHPEAKDA